MAESRTVLAEAAEAIDALFQPAHLDGCLFKADRRMPCQCGSWERERAAIARVKDSATRLRQVEQVLMEYIAACDAVDAEAERAEQPGANAWSSAPMVRLMHARAAVRSLVTDHQAHPAAATEGGENG